MPFTRKYIEERCREFLEAQRGYQANVDWIEQQLNDELIENMANFLETFVSVDRHLPTVVLAPDGIRPQDRPSLWRRFVEWMDEAP